MDIGQLSERYMRSTIRILYTTMAVLKGLKNSIATLNSQKQENVQTLPSVLSLMIRQLPNRLRDIKYNDY
jgi:hypothetical protein